MLLHRDTITACRQALGPEHRHTLVAATNFAGALEEQGSGKDPLLPEAVDIHREVLDVRRRVLGREHPETLATATNLASTLGHPGASILRITPILRWPLLPFS